VIPLGNNAFRLCGRMFEGLVSNVYPSRPKHVEKRNKRTKKICAPSWIYLQDYTRMHGQQDLKFVYRSLQLVCDVVRTLKLF